MASVRSTTGRSHAHPQSPTRPLEVDDTLTGIPHGGMTLSGGTTAGP
ncbi:MAG: hypothetical protein AVDCRST_MAG66-4767 [uncultured Pseudonocardia sp.]|uniref:Uncharacterized protein n=1 Tax=uncultured Pseudonocardia sp. TaxID=211455 RepID=A0A6J4QMZ5_9PSEU|nr:MAG: hypothetical protein AVDCRST_MAG66-4767 [uncultured Pseudonocardia sp.]